MYYDVHQEVSIGKGFVMYQKFKRVCLYVLVSFVVSSCVVVGLKHMMPIEKERAQIQKQRGVDTVETVDVIIQSLPEDSPPQIVQGLQTIRDMGEGIQQDATLSERWTTAGEKVMGPPPTTIRAGSTEEIAILTQTESEAVTLGKVRDATNTAKKIMSVTTSGGGLMSWATGGGLLATLTAVGAVAKVGHTKLKEQEEQRKKERSADWEAQRQIQVERDQAQDQKLDTIMTMMTTRINQLENSLKVPSKPSGETQA